MFNKMKEWIRKVMNTLIPKADIQKALDVDIAISNDMVNSIELWSKVYENRADWINPKEGVFSMEIASAIASEFARQATIEMKSTVSNKFINKQYQYVINDLRECMEHECALGGFVFKPYISNGDIIVDYVQADQFFPVAYDSRKRITSAIFPEQIVKGKKRYVRLEYHKYENHTHTITNNAFLKVNDGNNSNVFTDLGKAIDLASVPEWATLEPEFSIENVDRPLFAYVRVPGANNIDKGSPLGMSIFKKAIDLIREADKQYGRLIWEFEGGELAIDASEDALRADNAGNLEVPKNKMRLYRMHEDREGKNTLFEIFAPAFRDASLLNGFNDMLKRIEFNVGLSYGTLSDPQNTDKTATEIKTSKQRFYSTVTDLQKSMSIALDNLVYAMNVYAIGLGKSKSMDIKVKHTWDDSILVDTEKEQIQDMQKVNNGLMLGWEFRMKWNGETKKEAMAMLNTKKETGLTFENDLSDIDTTDIKEQVEETAGKALNGAQTQSLLAILNQYAANSISLGQAINVLSTAIGISKEKAKEIIEGFGE